MSWWLRFDFSSAKLDSLREQLNVKAKRLHEVLFARAQALTLMLQTKVIGKLSGDVLKVRTGVLRGSVNANTTTDGGTITGTVASSGGPAFYGRFHEMGVPHAWQIRATRSKALAFQLSVKESAQKVFARSVVHPPLPQRSFMRSTLEENEDTIRQALAQAVADVIREK
jgi:hypothetical protein